MISIQVEIHIHDIPNSIDIEQIFNQYSCDDQHLHVYPTNWQLSAKIGPACLD